METEIRSHFNLGTTTHYYTISSPQTKKITYSLWYRSNPRDPCLFSQHKQGYIF